MNVYADLNYVVNTGTPPFQYVDWPEKEHEAQPPTYESHRCLIKDGRPKVAELALETYGFKFMKHESRVDDFYNTNQVSKIYDDEVGSIIKSELEASRVIVFDHTFRTVNKKVSTEKNTRAPVKAVHNDYTDRSARQRVQDLLSKNDADKVLKNRFAIVQTWRPINHPVISEPLAMCDGRTIPDSGFVPLQRRYKHRTAETYHISYDPKHHWYYFPEMTPDELIMFKVFDSRPENNETAFSAHSAFDLSTANKNKPVRESVESRALVIF
jgi:hypothetical protein|tara:strand:+ start:1946 stop:2752 length:807 start_codon:yes stop_codon:yes gene_type:complete